MANIKAEIISYFIANSIKTLYICLCILSLPILNNFVVIYFPPFTKHTIKKREKLVKVFWIAYQYNLDDVSEKLHYHSKAISRYISAKQKVQKSKTKPKLFHKQLKFLKISQLKHNQLLRLRINTLFRTGKNGLFL